MLCCMAVLHVPLVDCIHNNAARVVTQSNQCTPSQPLLQSLHWLPVQQRFVYKTALITYKVITTSTPSYLNDLLAVHIPAGPTRRSSTRPLLTVPHIASDFARRSFCLFHQLYGTPYLAMSSVVRRKRVSSQD